MSTDFTFRETEPGDIESCFVVRARTRENAISKEQLAQLGITPDFIAAHLASGRMKGWVCLHATNVVGFCHGDSQTGEVLVLAVLPEYEGKGIGKRLLSRVVEWLRSRGCQTVWLAATPRSTMRAHGFYRSLGWRPTGDKSDNGDEILRAAEAVR